ncbi:SCP2 sterol-binding domain-containing protein [Micromonospora sediminicola]|uniref:SCP2 sterol-binding domain-containing protein n=1 Tax=Micromonospora sediminicola TaxID=946078 RepID=UPI0033F2E6EC
MSLMGVRPTTVNPREYARLVKRAPAEELKRLMNSDQRSVVLDDLIHAMPGVYRSETAAAVNAVVHWRIGGRPDGSADLYEFVLSGGACRVSPEPQQKPDLTMALSGVDFLKLVTGNAHPIMLVMKGKLKTIGDMALAAKIPSLFDNPKP